MTTARQQGFSLVTVIFLITLLAVLMGAALTTMGVQSHTALLGVQSARAYRAAEAGLEWGTHRALADDACFAPTGIVLPPSANALAGFRADVTCARSAHREGGSLFNVFEITAVGSFGAGTPDAVSREIRATVSVTPP